MSTLYFYKNFLKKVRPHLGEPAHLTGQAPLHVNSPLIWEYKDLVKMVWRHKVQKMKQQMFVDKRKI